MDNSSLQSIKEVLDKDEAIAIAVGRNASLDDMGASLAFYLSLKEMGKKVTIACPTDPIVEISSLVGIDKVKKNFEGGDEGDLVVSFPYNEGEIEKVSYTLEEGFLNIVVKSGEKGLSFSKNDVKFKRDGGLPKTLFVIGTPRISDLGTLFDPEALKDTTVINIDNKSDNQGFGDIVFVSSRFSSVCEQITDLLMFLGGPVDIDIAQNLLSGISFATDNFQSPKTSPFAFEKAAILMNKGAVRPRISQIEKRDFEDFEERGFGTKPQSKWEQPQIKTPGYFKQQAKSQAFDNRPKPFQKNPVSQFSQGGVKQQTAPKQNSTNVNNDENEEETPADWLTPKIYKGSTSI